jgi:putative transposase
VESHIQINLCGRVRLPAETDNLFAIAKVKIYPLVIDLDADALGIASSLLDAGTALPNGRRFRSLTIVDIYTRESLAIEAGQSLRGEDVVRVLNRLKKQRGLPKMLFCDNGSEFTGQLMDLWAYRNGVKIDFSRPGKPTDNAFVESFNGTFRAECLDTNWFQSLSEARQIIEVWRREYNESRPHRALAHRTPTEFASQIAASRDLAERKTGRELTI